MRHLAFLLIAASAVAQEGSIAEESWFVITVNGGKAGWSHETRRTIREGDREIVRIETSKEMRLKRLGDEIKIVEESTYDETADGGPVRFRYRTLQSRDETVQTGQVVGDKLEVTVRSGGVEEKKMIVWKAGYLFPAGAERLAKSKGFAVGTSYSYETYSPEFGNVITAEMKVVGTEKIKVGGEERELAKVEATISAMPGIVTTEWVDSEGRIIKSTVSLMGITIVAEKADRATALLSDRGDVPEVLVKSLLRPARKLDDPRKVTKAVYRITVKEGEARAGGLAYGGQTVDKVEGKTVTITVDPPRPGDTVPKLPIDNADLKEYLEETTVLQCKDAKVVAAAKDAVGGEFDAWKAAKKIERWVFEKIRKKGFGVGFASAREVAERLEGDCTEHSVLAAAMARAVGIPSRVAVGLVSVGEIYGGHMWTEVWVGRWVPLDATFGAERFDATHIKMGESAGSGTGLQEDLLNVLFFIGNMDLEILEVEEGK